MHFPVRVSCVHLGSKGGKSIFFFFFFFQVFGVQGSVVTPMNSLSCGEHIHVFGLLF